MEYRSQAAGGRMSVTTRVAAGIVLLGGLCVGQSFDFEVRRERGLRDHVGRITIDAQGVRYEQTLPAKKRGEEGRKKSARQPDRFRLEYGDIQQLWLSPEKIVVLTYADRKWLLGADREFEFYLTGEKQNVTPVYELLKNKLDQRFTAALADPGVEAEWKIRVKRQGAVQGSEGVLRIGQSRIVYETARKGHSRTWRIEDIDNVSSSGPFDLQLTTFERAIVQYGSRKAFHFQLKERLDTKRLDELWRRLQRNQGLDFLTSIENRRLQ